MAGSGVHRPPVPGWGRGAGPGGQRQETWSSTRETSTGCDPLLALGDRIPYQL